MKRAAVLTALIFGLTLVLACGGSEAPKPAAKKGDKTESDWSAASQVKEIEEMGKAGQKPAPTPEKGVSAPAPVPAPAAPKK
ncbi:MAG: hypothetical protein HPY67_08425 [Syntrophaceae bacterium]|nr:hypothetical protein [Syntrophaceae bacterium]